MAIRVISSVVGFPFLAIAVLLGGIYLKLLILLLAFVGMFEFYRATSKKNAKINYLGYVFAMVYILFIDYFLKSNFIAFIILFMILLLSITVIFHNKFSFIDATNTFYGFCYVCILLSTIYIVRMLNHGEFFVWFIFISAWACDTGAYFAGVNLGKHKLIPSLSPKKTVEGSIGGILSAALFAGVFALIYTKVNGFYSVKIVVLSVIIGFIGSIFAQIGDLSASAIKRYTKIKDFGKIMPGHGGILDRFDSVLFTAPVVYLLIVFLKLN